MNYNRDLCAVYENVTVAFRSAADEICLYDFRSSCNGLHSFDLHFTLHFLKYFFITNKVLISYLQYEQTSNNSHNSHNSSDLIG